MLREGRRSRGQRSKQQKSAAAIAAALFLFLLNSFDFVALEAARADVIGRHLAVLLIGDLLHVRRERSLRLAVGVAHVVPRDLTFSADTAYSRHISTSARIVA